MDRTKPSILFAYPRREHQAQRDKIERAVSRVLRSGAYVMGEEIAGFEEAFSRFTGARHTIAVSSGTDALVCALSAIGAGAGDEVLVPAFGFVAAAEAVVRVGARPIFVDIESDTLGPDPQSCANARTHRTRAVVVMHLFGQAVDLDPVRRALDGLPIVEDAAQAIGTKLDHRQVGTIAEVGIFSFFPAKALGAAGDAGAVTTSDDAIAERAKRCRVHGNHGAYEWESLGGNYRMDAVQAAVLSVKLKILERRLARRRQIGERLTEALARHRMTVFSGGASCQATYSPLAVRTPRRDDVMIQLRECGIDVRVHYPLTLSSAPAFRFAESGQAYPEAERATRELLSIPCSPELSDDEVKKILDAIHEVQVA